MNTKVKERVKAEPQRESCRHYWVIEVANGPASQGQCKYCGVKKEFYNAFPEYNPLKKGQVPVKLPVLPPMEVEEEEEVKAVLEPEPIDDEEDESLVTG